MWFDARGVLASLNTQHGGRPPATSATSATRILPPARKLARVSEVAEVAAPRVLTPDRLTDALNAFEERAAIREFDGRQPRPEAEQAALHETAVAYNIAPEVLTRHIREQETGR